jgi:Putative Ig domain
MQLRVFGVALGIVVAAFIVGCNGGEVVKTSTATLAITTTSLSEGTVGSPYSAALAAVGGTSPYSWSILSGSLPPGLSLSASGVISGTATAGATSKITVQAKDSASVQQTATSSLTLTIVSTTAPAPPATLQITTTALAAGTLGVAYSAVGGTPPYTWSIGSVPLPAGLTLNASTGAITGTPTALVKAFPSFSVSDSAHHSVSVQNVNLTINPPVGSLPNGTYSFNFGGAATQQLIGLALNGSFTLSNGTITAGVFDENASYTAPLVKQKISGGTLIAYTNGLGQLSLTLPAGTVSFVFAAPASASTAANDSDIRIIEFDDVGGTGSRGSGVMKLAQAPQPTSAIKGNYAFHFSGSDAQNLQASLVGAFQTDGNGNITGGKADFSDDGKVTNYPTLTGTYAVDAQNRGSLKLVLDATTTFSYSFYQVSPTELLGISTDQASVNIPVESGSILQQTGPFSNASLNGVAVLELQGLARTQGGSTTDATLGVVTADGKGNVSVSYDEAALKFVPQTAYTGTYAVDPTSGRVVVTTPSGTPPILYLINNNTAFVLGTDPSSSTGVLEPQSGAPFANASFTGNYLGGTVALSNAFYTNLAGLVAADGKGNAVITANTSGRSGVSQYDTLTATYAGDSHGRIPVTAPDGTSRIFYVVSPKKVVFLNGPEGTAGVYLGSFEQ